jgi:hypothetical protein
MKTPSAANQLAGFLAKFNPAIAKLAKTARAKFRKRLPGAVEMVYDNYNALVIGFSPSARPSDAILSIVVFPKRVSVCFIQGKHLPDPHKVLQGDGNQVRFIRLDERAAFSTPRRFAPWSTRRSRSAGRRSAARAGSRSAPS